MKESNWIKMKERNRIKMKKTLLRGLICSLFILITAVVSAVSVSAEGAVSKGAAVTSVSYNSVKIGWEGRKKAEGYRIESYENGKWSTVTEITDGEINSFIVDGLKPGTDYCFRLKYYKIKDNKKKYYYLGEPVCCTTTLPKVTGFSVTTGTDSAQLLWNPSADCDGYEVQKRSGTKWITMGELKDPKRDRASIINLTKGKEYDFRIRAYKNSTSGVIYSQYSYITCTASDKQSIKLFGPNMVYTGESFDYTYCFEGSAKCEVKWSVIGNCGKITDKGCFTAVGKGTCAVVVTDLKENVYAFLDVHCVDSSKDVDFMPLVNGINIANKTYPLPEDYDPGLIAEAEKAFEAMKKGALKDGIELFSISDYRSYQRQVKTYKYWKDNYGDYADAFSAKPGFSEHQLGLAIDVNDMWVRFAATKEGKWLAKNCYKYGFILRYPSYAAEISTGYEYEPWHVRYVGKKLAKKVHFSGSTLEEYLGIDSFYR